MAEVRHKCPAGAAVRADCRLLLLPCWGRSGAAGQHPSHLHNPPARAVRTYAALHSRPTQPNQTSPSARHQSLLQDWTRKQRESTLTRDSNLFILKSFLIFIPCFLTFQVFRPADLVGSFISTAISSPIKFQLSRIPGVGRESRKTLTSWEPSCELLISRRAVRAGGLRAGDFPLHFPVKAVNVVSFVVLCKWIHRENHK